MISIGERKWAYRWWPSVIVKVESLAKSAPHDRHRCRCRLDWKQMTVVRVGHVPTMYERVIVFEGDDSVGRCVNE